MSTKKQKQTFPLYQKHKGDRFVLRVDKKLNVILQKFVVMEYSCLWCEKHPPSFQNCISINASKCE